jgi:hypothetical protein
MTVLKKVNLLILGAQKSGTTSLHSYLAKHTDVYMSAPEKEPRYFLPLDKCKTYFLNQKGLNINSKEQLMSDLMYPGYKNEKYFGESSTDYTIGENSVEFNLPYEIRKYNEDMKFIYILRNPFQRLISVYKHQKRAGRVTCNFNDFISTLDEKHIQTSLYHHQLSKYTEYFDKKNIFVTKYEDFFSDPKENIKDIYRFLDIAPTEGVNEFKSFNKSADLDAYLFSEENYSKLAKYFLSDSKLLQNEFFSNQDNEWDLGKDKWIK